MNYIRQRIETFQKAALLALFILRRDAGLCRLRISMSLSQSKSSHMLATFLIAVVVFSLAGATPALAQSCTDSWTGGGGTTNWSNGANWSDGNEPGNNDNVCIQQSGVLASTSMAPQSRTAARLSCPLQCRLAQRVWGSHPAGR
jgi:hypothetical protein